MTYDDRRRYGHSLLGVVALAVIVFVAFLLATAPPRHDWTCDQTDAVTRALVKGCEDIDY